MIKAIRTTLAAAVALGLLSALPVAAAERDDRFTLRLGAMNADAQGELSDATQVLGQDVSFAEEFDFGSNEEVVPRIDATFRMSQRNRLLFDHFRYDKSQRAVLGNDLSFEDTTIPAGSFAEAEVEFELASLLRVSDPASNGDQHAHAQVATPTGGPEVAVQERPMAAMLLLLAMDGPRPA